MNLTDPNQPAPEEVPADPTTQRDLRRILLYLALIGLLAPCGLCWYSTRVESIEQALIPTLAGLIIGVYTLFTLYQREQKQDLAPPLWRVILILILLAAVPIVAQVWLVSAVGWQPLASSIIQVLGLWGLFLSGRRVWESWRFSRMAVLEENDLVELKMISIDGGHPIHPQLIYRYADKYRGQKRSSRLRDQLPEVRQAIADGKLRVMVQYLPESPKVHRFLGWKIL